MRRLRKRVRHDRLHTELRNDRGRLGRWIYLTLLGLLLAYLLNLFLGDLVYLSAEGMVTRDRHVVSLGFPATVGDLRVAEGERVEAGELLLSVDSIPILQDIAELSARLGEFRARRQELVARRLVIEETLPVARDHAAAVSELLSSREGALREGLTTNTTLHELFRADYANRKEVAELAAELEALDLEIEGLMEIIDEFSASLERLESRYDNGRVRAPRAGIVADLQVSAGSGVREDQPLMDLLVGESYVLAYIRPGAMYEVRVGDPVQLQYGVVELAGRISATFPLSVQLPSEFQRAFQPQERSQVVRVKIEDDRIPPVFTKVTVKSSHSLLAQLWRLFDSSLLPAGNS
jgi:multidrug resistance efflux pump